MNTPAGNGMTPVRMASQFAEFTNACVRDFGDAKCWVLLVSGPYDHVLKWWLDTFAEFFDSRKQTCRFRYWFVREEDPVASLTRVIDAARRCDVTVQLLCTYEAIEESAKRIKVGDATVVVRDLREQYPICHLGSHGMRWGT